MHQKLKQEHRVTFTGLGLQVKHFVVGPLQHNPITLMSYLNPLVANKSIQAGVQMNLSEKLPSAGLRRSVCLALGFIACLATRPSFSQEKPPAPPSTDVVVFKNGDQLTGKFERSVGSDIIFKSDAVGEVTIPMDKMKDLRSSSSFVVLKKDERSPASPRPANDDRAR